MESNAADNAVNPYEAPSGATSVIDDRHIQTRFSLMRGVLCAIPTAALGFSVPYVILAGAAILKSLSAENPNALGYDLRDILELGFYALFECTLIFAFAGFVNFAPALRLGFTRALLIFGLMAFPALILAAIVNSYFGFYSYYRGYGNDVLIMKARIVFCSVQILVAVFLSGFLIYLQNRKARLAFAGAKGNCQREHER